MRNFRRMDVSARNYRIRKEGGSISGLDLQDDIKAPVAQGRNGHVR